MTLAHDRSHFAMLTMRLLLGFPQFKAEPRAFSHSPGNVGIGWFCVPTGSSFNAIHHLWGHISGFPSKVEATGIGACSDFILHSAFP